MDVLSCGDGLASVCFSNGDVAVLLVETLLLYCQRHFAFHRLNAKTHRFYAHICALNRPCKKPFVFYRNEQSAVVNFKRLDSLVHSEKSEEEVEMAMFSYSFNRA